MTLTDFIRAQLRAYPQLYSLARTVYGHSRRKRPVDPLSQALMDLSAGRPDLAITKLNSSHAIGSRHLAHLPALAQAEERLHWWPEAANSWRKVLDQLGSSLEAELALARITFEQGKIEQALDAYKRIATVYKDSPEPIKANLRVAQTIEDWRRASELLGILSTLHVTDPELAELEAQLLTARNEFDKALEICDTRVTTHDAERGLFLKVDTLVERRYWREAIELIEGDGDVQPPHELFFKKLAAFNMGRKFSRAIDALEQLLASEPPHPHLQIWLAQCYVWNGDDDNARRAIAAVPAIWHRYRPMIDLLGWQRGKSGDIAGAKKYWKAAAFRPRTQTRPDMAEPVTLVHRPKGVSGNAPVKLLTLVRNETMRLPFFLDYYRKIGIEEFYIVDNDSNDGTVEYLTTQADVVLFHTKGNFLRARDGVYWLNYIMNTESGFRWVLYLDLDELLIVPEIETHGLTSVIEDMDQRGEELMMARMFDMFPETIERGLAYQAGDNPLNASPYFDLNHTYVGDILFPYTKYQGGASERFTGRINVDHLGKVPLIRADRGIRFIESSHWVTPGKVSATTGALLHFKFIGPFLEVFKLEGERKAYPHGSERYLQFYQTLSSMTPTERLLGEHSVHFLNSEQLLKLGLIRKGA